MVVPLSITSIFIVVLIFCHVILTRKFFKIFLGSQEILNKMALWI